MGKLDDQDATCCSVEHCVRPGRARIGDTNYCIAHLVDRSAGKPLKTIGTRYHGVPELPKEENTKKITRREISAFIMGMVTSALLIFILI